MRFKEVTPVIIVSDFIGSVKEEAKDENGNVTHTFEEHDILIEKYVKIDGGEIILCSSEEDATIFSDDIAHDVIAIIQGKTGIERWLLQNVLDEPMLVVTDESLNEFGVFVAE